LVDVTAAADLTPEMVRSGLAPELDLLLTLAQLDLSRSDLDRCEELLRLHATRMDWGSFVDQACRHKIMPLVARNIVRYRLDHGADGSRPIPYIWLYPAVCVGNRVRNEALAVEFASVLRALNDAQVQYAVRKGPVLADHLYGDPRTRRMNDLDLLIGRQDAERVGDLLRRLGYTQGRPNRDGTAIEPFDRRSRAFWRMNVNNELPFVKLGHCDEVEVFIVDLCLDLFQAASTACASVPELLARRTPLVLCGEPSFALSLPDQLIDVCAHLHKEATALYYIEGGGDLQLQKFLDVSLTYRAVREAGLWAATVAAVSSFGAAEPVYYALHFTSLLYPGAVSPGELVDVRPADLRFLDEYAALDGRRAEWRRPFHARLFDAHRGREVHSRSTVPPA
jgi:hypothetical protein